MNTEQIVALSQLQTLTVSSCQKAVSMLTDAVAFSGSSRIFRKADYQARCFNESRWSAIAQDFPDQDFVLALRELALGFFERLTHIHENSLGGKPKVKLVDMPEHLEKALTQVFEASTRLVEQSLQSFDQLADCA